MSLTYWSPANDQQLLAMIAAGHTNREIAQALGRSIPGVKQRRMHINAPQSPSNRIRRPRTKIAALVAAIEAEPVPVLKRRLRKQLVLAVWRRRVVRT